MFELREIVCLCLYVVIRVCTAPPLLLYVGRSALTFCEASVNQCLFVWLQWLSLQLYLELPSLSAMSLAGLDHVSSITRLISNSNCFCRSWLGVTHNANHSDESSLIKLLLISTMVDQWAKPFIDCEAFVVYRSCSWQVSHEPYIAFSTQAWVDIEGKQVIKRSG